MVIISFYQTYTAQVSGVVQTECIQLYNDFDKRRNVGNGEPDAQASDIIPGNQLRLISFYDIRFKMPDSARLIDK